MESAIENRSRTLQLSQVVPENTMASSIDSYVLRHMNGFLNDILFAWKHFRTEGLLILIKLVRRYAPTSNSIIKK
jgi:hypothetical protein